MAKAFNWWRWKRLRVCPTSVAHSNKHSLLHPVCYILGRGPVVFIVVEELPLPGKQGEKSRSSLPSVNSEEDISWSLTHTITIEPTSILVSLEFWINVKSLEIKRVKNAGLLQTVNQRGPTLLNRTKHRWINTRAINSSANGTSAFTSEAA